MRPIGLAVMLPISGRGCDSRGLRLRRPDSRSELAPPTEQRRSVMVILGVWPRCRRGCHAVSSDKRWWSDLAIYSDCRSQLQKESRFYVLHRVCHLADALLV